MTPAILSAESQPTVGIFLDIDGVLLGNVECGPIVMQIKDKSVELFGEKETYTELEQRIARSYFFSKKAVAWFEKLIETVIRVAKVVIILSSSWRQHGSLDEIKTMMFPTRNFSKFIVDKTVDDDSLRVKRGEEPLFSKSPLDPEFLLGERSLQIDRWLQENREKLNICTFAIIDDCNLAFTEKFPNHFVEIRAGLFSKEHAEKALKILKAGLPVVDKPVKRRAPSPLC